LLVVRLPRDVICTVKGDDATAAAACLCAAPMRNMPLREGAVATRHIVCQCSNDLRSGDFVWWSFSRV
jgi:hypothetical protein